MQQINDCGVRTASRYLGLNYWEYSWRKGGVRMIDICKRETSTSSSIAAVSTRYTNEHRVAMGRELICLGEVYYGQASDTQPSSQEPGAKSSKV